MSSLPDITNVGGELVVVSPGNKHAGTLIQVSPDAPDEIFYQPPDRSSRPVPWETDIDNDLFRVESGETSGQYVYDEAQVLKDELNALAADDKYFRETLDLKYWSS